MNHIECFEFKEDKIHMSITEVLQVPQFINRNETEEFREVKIKLFTSERSVKLNFPFNNDLINETQNFIRLDRNNQFLNYELNTSGTITSEGNEYTINFNNNHHYNFIEISYIEKIKRLKSFRFWKGYKNNIVLPFIELNDVRIIELEIRIPKGMKLTKLKSISKSSIIKTSNSFFYYINIEEYVKNINISYKVIPNLDLIFYGSVFVGIILILYSINSFLKIFIKQSIEMPEIGLLLALFSLSALIFQLKKGNRQIPGYSFLVTSMGITLIVILSILVIYLISLFYNLIVHNYHCIIIFIQ